MDAAGKKIALFNVDGTFYAIDETCTHRGGPLSEGMLMGIEVTCPWHGAVFDVRTGSVLGPPAPKGVARYNVRVEGDDIGGRTLLNGTPKALPQDRALLAGSRITSGQCNDSTRSTQCIDMAAFTVRRSSA